MFIKIFGKKKKCQSNEGIKHSLKRFIKKLSCQSSKSLLY